MDRHPDTDQPTTTAPPARTRPSEERRRRRRRRTVGGIVAAAVAGSVVVASLPTSGPAGADPEPAVRTIEGALDDGATWRIDVPADWNGTLALYSHGVVPPGDPNPAESAYDPLTAGQLLAEGYALAGSSYASTGWAVEDALEDQLEVLEVFRHEVAKPERTVAWGISMGGLVTTALVEQHPGRFDGGLAMCGNLDGPHAEFGSMLDLGFVFTTLLAGGTPLEVTGIDDPGANLEAASGVFEEAAATATGRARLALAAAMTQTPGWIDPDIPEPTDLEGRTENRLAWLQEGLLPLTFALRAEIEQRAGGNPSSNVGIDHADLLARSGQRADVVALYELAGADLDADLAALADAPRVQADRAAARYLADNVTPTGRLRRPLLTVHGVGDGIVPVQHEDAYATTVAGRGREDQLGQLFVDRAGHCTFTAAEVVAAFDALISRIDGGAWPGDLAPTTMNHVARDLGPDLNVGGPGVPVEPAYRAFVPGPLLRADTP